MIQTIAVVLGRLAQLAFLEGYRTQISAVGLIGLAIYLITAGQFELGLTNLFFALGLVGIRFRFTPTAPILPGQLPVEHSAEQLREQATMLDDLIPERKPDAVVMGLTSKVMHEGSDRATRRRHRREQAIDGLRNAGVSGSAILAWLPVIIALLQTLPEVMAVVQKILDAIAARKSPSQVATEERLTARG